VNKFQFVTLTLMLLLLVMMPAAAQEATQEATPVVIAPDETPIVVQPGLQVPEWAWFAGMLLLSGIGGGVLFVLNKAIDGLKASYPEASKEMWEQAGLAADRGWVALKDYVQKTPTTYDDLPVAILEPLIESLIKRLAGSYQASGFTAVSVGSKADTTE